MVSPIEYFQDGRTLKPIVSDAYEAIAGSRHRSAAFFNLFPGYRVIANLVQEGVLGWVFWGTRRRHAIVCGREQREPVVAYRSHVQVDGYSADDGQAGSDFRSVTITDCC